MVTTLFVFNQVQAPGLHFFLLQAPFFDLIDHKNVTFLPQNLVISKKSITFVPDFLKTV